MPCPNCGFFTPHHTIGSCFDGSTDYDHKCTQCGHEWTYKVAPRPLSKKEAKEFGRARIGRARIEQARILLDSEPDVS